MKKTKLLLIFFLMILICSMMVLLTACDGDIFCLHDYHNDYSVIDDELHKEFPSCIKCYKENRPKEKKHEFKNGKCECGFMNGTAGLTYTLSEDGESYFISEFDNAGASQIIIPLYYKHKEITGIASDIFSENSLITEIYIPENTNIGNRAFYNCVNLQTLTIYSDNSNEEDQLGNIGDYAFAGCKNLVRKNLTLQDVGAYAFAECSGLSGNLTANNVGDVAFGACTGLNGTLTANNVGNYAFAVTALKEVNLSKIMHIGKYAFAKCENLEKLNISGISNGHYNSEIISDLAFAYCTNLKDIVIKDIISLKNISFLNCEKLENLTLEGVEKLSISAFAMCKNLKNLILPESLREIIYPGVSQFSTFYLENISIDENNTVFKSENNCLLTKDGTQLILGCKNSIIPDSVISINKAAFFGNKLLTSINIPKDVSIIEEQVFSGCDALESIIVDSDNQNFKSENNCLLTKDGNTLIAVCKNSATPQNVTSIGDAYTCNQWITEVIVPEKVTVIEAYAFAYCGNMTSITLSNNLKEIEEFAFYISNLETINFNGTIAEWQTIINNSHNDWNVGVDFVVICRDGKLDKLGNIID